MIIGTPSAVSPVGERLARHSNTVKRERNNGEAEVSWSHIEQEMLALVITTYTEKQRRGQ